MGVYLHELLNLRGLLPQGALAFVIGEKRWLVDYGCPVPAKDEKDENPESSHSNMAIVPTCLSYYYHGLSEERVRHCFKLLAKYNDPATEYQPWITSALLLDCRTSLQ